VRQGSSSQFYMVLDLREYHMMLIFQDSGVFCFATRLDVVALICTATAMCCPAHFGSDIVPCSELNM